MPTITTVHHPAARSSAIYDLAYDACTSSGDWVPVTRQAWRQIRRTEQRIRSYLAGRPDVVRCRIGRARTVQRSRRVARRSGAATRGTAKSSSDDGPGPGDGYTIVVTIVIGGVA